MWSGQQCSSRSQYLLEQFEFQLEMLYVKFQHFPEMCLWFLYGCASKSKMQALTSNVRDIFTSFPKFLNVKSTNLSDMFLYIHTRTYSLFPYLLQIQRYRGSSMGSEKVSQRLEQFKIQDGDQWLLIRCSISDLFSKTTAYQGTRTTGNVLLEIPNKTCSFSQQFEIQDGSTRVWLADADTLRFLLGRYCMACLQMRQKCSLCDF